MTGTAGPRLGLVWGYSPHETGWGVGGFNPNFALLEALVHLTIVSITSTPPVSPTNGDVYVVGTSPTGVWVGHAKAIAVYYTATSWTYVTPVVGIRAFNRATTSYWRYNGTDWIEEVSPTADVSGPGGSTAGNIAVWDDTTGQVLADGGQPLPVTFLVGTEDTQLLKNKVIDGADNSLVVHLDTDIVGNLDVSYLNGGVGANSTTAWFGDGTWKHVVTADTGPVIISDTAPSSPVVGALWFDSSDTMALYIWYDDGTTQQWVAT